MQDCFLVVTFSLCFLSLSPTCLGGHAKEATHTEAPSDKCDYVPIGKPNNKHRAVLGREDTYLSDDGRFRMGKDDNYWWVNRELKTGHDYGERMHMDAALDIAKLLSFGQRSMVALNEKGELLISINKNRREGPIDGPLPPNDAVKIAEGFTDFRVTIDGKKIVALTKEGGVEEIVLNDAGQLASRNKLFSFENVISGALSERNIATITTGKITLYDAMGKKFSTIPVANYPLSPAPHIAFSRDGKKLGVLFATNKVLIIDPVSGESRTVSLPVDEKEESPFGARRLRIFRDGEMLQVSAQSGDSRLFFSPRNSRGLEAKLVSHFYRTGQAMEFESEGKTYFFLPAERRGRHPQVIEDFRMECVPKQNVTDPIQTARAWMTPKAFDPQKDLGKLIFLVREHPELIDCLQPALLVLDNDSELTANWVAKLRSEEPVNTKPVAARPSCSFPKGTESEWKGQFEKLLRRHTAEFGGYDEYYWSPTRPRDWEFLERYSKFIPLLSDVERESLRERIARSAALEPAQLDYRLSTISPGVARELISDSLSDFFRVPSEHSVEIQLYEGGTPETTFLNTFSTQAVQANGARPQPRSTSSTAFQFHITEVPLKSDGKHGTAEIRVGKDRFLARVKLASDFTSAKSIEYSEIKPFLLDDNSCKFFSAGSHSVKDGVLYELLDKEKHRKDRVSVVTSPETALRDCRAFKEKIGTEGCANLEFAGHSTGGCGVSGIFGIAGLEGGTSHPAREFNDLIGCYKSLLPSDKPVIFTSCGGYGKRQTRNMFRMAKLFDRRIIAANGPCSSDGWGALCEPGWLEVPKPTPGQIQEFEDSELSITKK